MPNKTKPKFRSIRPKAQKGTKKNKPKSEITEMGKLIRSIGQLGGGALGSFVGQPGLGGQVGHGLAASLSKWLGQGDYKLNANSLVTKFEHTGTIPSMHSTSQSTTIRHKEYILDIYVAGAAPTAFSTFGSFPLNPGVAGTFPWLSSIAQQYQEYKFKGLIFEYVSTSGELVSTTASLGSVMFATQYRASAPTFANKQVMMNEFFSSDSKPSESFCHPVECNPHENPFSVQYVRSNTIPAGDDIKSYDLGTFYVATQGMPAAEVVGELWVSYEVELYKPIATSVLDLYGVYFHMRNNTGITNAAPLGTSTGWLSTASQGNTLGLPSFSGTSIAFPLLTVGTFMILLSWTNCTAFIAPTITGGGNAIVNQSRFDNVGVFSGTEQAQYTVGSQAGFQAMIFTITDSNQYAYLNFGPATLTGCTSLDLVITQIPYGST